MIMGGRVAKNIKKTKPEKHGTGRIMLGLFLLEDELKEGVKKFGTFSF